MSISIGIAVTVAVAAVAAVAGGGGGAVEDDYHVLEFLVLVEAVELGEHGALQ